MIGARSVPGTQEGTLFLGLSIAKVISLVT